MFDLPRRSLSLVTIVLVLGEDIEHGIGGTGEIDYSELATLAETNRNDLLGFLNDKTILEKYNRLYDTLLDSLIDELTNNRIYFDRNKPKSINQTHRLRPEHIDSCRAVASVTARQDLPDLRGSIVTDIWTLTAAHCLLKARANELSVRLGSSWKTHSGQMYDVKERYVHPRYSSKTKSNDVGLVRLYAPLRFTAKVLPIRVIPRETRLPADRAAIVSGWGKLKEGGPSATYLQSTTIKTIAMKLCRGSGLDKNAIDPATMFCAGSFSSPTPDACQGDSGGPIVQNGVLIGVVSWGLGCARGNFPGVYTRLSYPIIWDWLQSHIKK